MPAPRDHGAKISTTLRLGLGICLGVLLIRLYYSISSGSQAKGAYRVKDIFRAY
jgi:hypothetical protein